MPERIPVQGPSSDEELRQLAVAIADLHYVVGIIVENAKELVPGEAIDELNAAWKKAALAERSMKTLVENLKPSPVSSSQEEQKIAPTDLIKGDLLGEVGTLKRSTLGRLKDAFFMWWNSEPHTDEKRAKAADAACDYLDYGATVVSSIPGYDQVEELLLLVKQLVSVRSKRGV